jgi:transposase
MGSLNTNLNVGRDTRSPTARDVDARLSQLSKKTEGNAVASRPWAEFRLAVVGHLAFRELEPGQLEAELRALSTKEWKHPISGRQVKFSYSTMQRWYYIILNNPDARIPALSKRRRDVGLFRNLSKRVCRFLASQANGQSSQSYAKHHRNLIRYMKQYEWGPPPAYSTVRRYLKSLRCSRNGSSDANIVRLEELVVHLRRTLIVQSTLNWLLGVPGLRTNSVGPSFKYSRLGPREKVYVLSRLRNYQSTGGSVVAFCSAIGISEPSIERWRASYRRCGEPGLCPRTRRRFPNRVRAKENQARILEIFHNRPQAYGINRASWTGKSLATALLSKFQVRISRHTAVRYLRKSGYTMRRARQVLTSPDSDYQAKVEILIQTLRSLGNGELLFFADELGPIAVKKHGGRSYVKRNEAFVVPQLQTPTGSIVLAGALSATTNQVTWCFVSSKDTSAMIDIIELLFNQHQDKTRLYITWDAASWYDSGSLIDWLDSFNLKTTEAKVGGPLINLVPLPSHSQFLNVIESVFGVMKKAIIHHSDYQTTDKMKSAISLHLRDRNAYFTDNPRRAGKKIWEIDFFRDPGNLSSGNYRDY